MPGILMEAKLLYIRDAHGNPIIRIRQYEKDIIDADGVEKIVIDQCIATKEELLEVVPLIVKELLVEQEDSGSESE